jgi:hypothetical protein
MPLDLAWGDLDASGLVDVLTANAGDGTVSIVLNTGRGFAEAVTLPVAAAARSVAAFPVDCNSSVDVVVVADHPGIGGALFVLRNASPGPGIVGFDEPIAFSVGADANAVVGGPLDVDERIDVATVNADDGPSGGSLSALLNVSACPCADANGDGVVDVLDLVEVLVSWGECPGCPADLNGDGVVDVLDLVEVLVGWGCSA